MEPTARGHDSNGDYPVDFYIRFFFFSPGTHSTVNHPRGVDRRIISLSRARAHPARSRYPKRMFFA